MKLRKIDFRKVEQALESDSQRIFNTAFHTAAEAGKLDGTGPPTERPYDFSIWLPLIISTRGLHPSALQTVALSRAQVHLLVQASASSVITRVLNRVHAEDIEDTILPILRAGLVFPPEGLFLRLERTSPKDGAHAVPGRRSLHSAEEVVLRVTSSMRARNDMIRCLDDGATQIKLFFLPFNDRMKSEREYRVFCSPWTPASQGGVISTSPRLTAVSQYQWHKPWMFADKAPQEMEVLGARILARAEDIYKQIREHILEDDLVAKLLVDQGLTFDVFFDEERDVVQLVELNSFGVMSSCGSCLFQWIEDQELLYGNSDEVEFRIAI